MSAAHQILDRLQSLARIEALEAEPAAYAEQLAGELADAQTLAELDARDARLRDALAQLDTAIERVARIRIDHALADDTSLPAATRKVFATTVLSYADRLELLAARVQDAAARGGSTYPADVAYRVTTAARAALALRADVRAPVLALIRERALAAAPLADRHARDRTLDTPARKQWSAARRDLETLGDAPDRITVAPMATRLAAWPEQIDEPDPGREPTFADMIELD
jgi:hypothetical protein